MILLDKLAYSSALRDTSPTLKCFFALTTLLICVWAQSAALALLVLSMMAALSLGKGRISLGYYLKRLSLPLGFSLLSTSTIMINYSSLPLDLWSLPLPQGWGGGYLAVSSQGLAKGLNLILVALGAASCLYFLALTTPMTQILYGLARLHCPWLLQELLLLTYRFIFILLDGAGAIHRAQNCRLGQGGFRIRLRAMGSLLAALLQQSLKKADALYVAMESRCYGGRIQVLDRFHQAPAWQWGLVALLEMGLAGLGWLL